MQEAEINDEGIVSCPICGYPTEVEKPRTVICENGGHVFKAVKKNATA